MSVPAASKTVALLRVAATIVNRDGWSALSIAGVAREGGVSRQWVHRLLGGIDGMRTRLVDHLLDDWYDGCLRVMAERLPFDETIRRYFDMLAEADPFLLAAMREMFAGTWDKASANYTEGRKAIDDLWAPLWKSERLSGSADQMAATAVVFWGSVALVGLVQGGALDRDSAKQILVKMARGAVVNTPQS